MKIETTRFGSMNVNAQRIITFPRGMLGYPRHKRYVLLDAGEHVRDQHDFAADSGDHDRDGGSDGGAGGGGSFWWLQSVDEPDLAFVVTDPAMFIPGYRVPLRADVMESLGVETKTEAQTFIVVNKQGDTLTGNLRGPIVVGVRQRLGEQLVLGDQHLTTRVKLMELPRRVAALAS